MQWLTEALGRLPKDFVYWYEWIMVGIFLTFLILFSFQVLQQNYFTKRAIQRLSQIRREAVEPTERVVRFDAWMAGYNGKKFLSLKAQVRAWDHFKKAYEDGLHNQSTSMPDVFLYFNEEQLRPRHGLRDIIPGLFLSFGILGTFIGVAAGLANLVLTEEMLHC
jgi:hypothetical protein